MHKLTIRTLADVQCKAAGTVSAAENRAAVRDSHPLLVSLDAMLRAADHHARRYESKICDDYFLGPRWLQAAVALRELLNGDFGPLDNGTGEAIFWLAMDAAGYTEKDI